MIRRIARTYSQCIRLVQYATNSRYRWALPEALLRIVQTVVIFIIRLRQEGLGPDADRYSASAFQICKLAAWICAENGDEDSLPLAVSAALMTKHGTSGEAVDWAKEVINSIKDDRVKQSAQFLFDRQMKRERGEEVEGDIDATARQVIENMATALGIDLSNPDDPAARMVQLGIADADPARVLKNCKHIFISLGPQPLLAVTTLLANVLGLPSIGSKMLHCDLHGHYVLEAALDSAYAAFKKRHCDSCPDSVPRPPGWTYSDEWQQEENLRHAAFMEDFFRRIRRRT